MSKRLNTKKTKNMAYVPPIVIEELEQIMEEDDLTTGANGFRKMAEYSKVGREIKKIATLRWPERKKKKRNLFDGGMF